MSVKFMVHRENNVRANLESDLAARAVYSAKESKGASPREKSEALTKCFREQPVAG